MKKLTHEQYLEKLWGLNNNYSSGCFEIIGKYVGSGFPIIVKDKYGECEVNPRNLLNGFKPTIVTAKDKTKYCINQFKEVHKDMYDYSKVKYTDSKNKVVITCKEHGDFKQGPHEHLIGQGCKECKRYSRLDGRRLTTEKFIKKSNKVHDNLYTYKKSDVKGNKNNVIITCKEHGDFKQTPNSHLKGRGCRECYLENNGYSRGKFVYFARKNKCRIYLIECFLKSERFLKVGITSKSVEVRFKGDKKLPYNYSIIKELEFSDSRYVWDQEVVLKKVFKGHKYRPNIKFKGHTECFKIEAKKEIINYLKLL